MTPPLSAYVRMSDADYPGVMRRLSSDWRLSVSMDGRRYRLQRVAADVAGRPWVSPPHLSASSLSKLLRKGAALVDGLAQACEGLPDDPAQACPSLTASHNALLLAFQARDMRRADYARVVVRDLQLRLVVDPSGLTYCLQWVRNADRDFPNVRWRRIFGAAVLSDVRDYMLTNCVMPVGPGPWNLVRGVDLLPRIDVFLSGLPERADAGVWPFVPPVPGTLQA